MANSGKPPGVSVLALLAVLVAVSLHATHRVSAGIPAGAYEWLAKANSNLAELSEKIADGGDVAKWFYDMYEFAGGTNDAQGNQGSTPVTRSAEGYYQVTVTGLKVGEQTVSLGSTLDNGGVVLFPPIPFTFLNKDAYALVKGAITGKTVTSQYGAKFDQLCYPAGTDLVSITLVFTGSVQMNVAAEDLWYNQGDGSMCLTILASPFEAGTTILGSFLLTAEHSSYDPDKKTLTFQTSTKVAMSSKTNTAAATKPSLGVWVLLLLVIILP